MGNCSCQQIGWTIFRNRMYERRKRNNLNSDDKILEEWNKNDQAQTTTFTQNNDKKCSLPQNILSQRKRSGSSDGTSIYQQVDERRNSPTEGKVTPPQKDNESQLNHPKLLVSSPKRMNTANDTMRENKKDVQHMSQDIERKLVPPYEGTDHDRTQKWNSKLLVSLPRKRKTGEPSLQHTTKERKKDELQYLSQNNEYGQSLEAPVSLPSEGKGNNRAQRSNSKVLVALPRKMKTREPSVKHTTKERGKEDVHHAMSQNNQYQQGGEALVSPPSEGKGNNPTQRSNSKLLVTLPRKKNTGQLRLK